MASARLLSHRNGLDLHKPPGFEQASAYDGARRMVIPKVSLQHGNVGRVVRWRCELKPERQEIIGGHASVCQDWFQMNSAWPSKSAGIVEPSEAKPLSPLMKSSLAPAATSTAWA